MKAECTQCGTERDDVIIVFLSTAPSMPLWFCGWGCVGQYADDRIIARIIDGDKDNR